MQHALFWIKYNQTEQIKTQTSHKLTEKQNNKYMPDHSVTILNNNKKTVVIS